MFCSSCGTDNPDGSNYCSKCSAPLQPGAITGDATGGVIPYKNPPALTAYYLGLFSAVVPILGFFMGIASLFLGCLGLKRRKETPQVKGSVHAWIGIGCGSLAILVWGGILVTVIVAAAGR